MSQPSCDPSGVGQNVLDLGRHLVDRRHAVDRLENALFAKVGQDRRRLRVIGGQAGAYGLLGGVGAAPEFGAAAVVAVPRKLRLLVGGVVDGAAGGEGVAPGEDMDQALIVTWNYHIRMKPVAHLG